MAQVKVWNDNAYPHKENFRDTVVEIPAKGHVLMEADQAHLFKCEYYPIRLDGDGQPMSQHFKMIRIEQLDGVSLDKVVVRATVCQACKYDASNEKDLSEHVKAMHSDIIAEVDAEAEEALKNKTARARL